MKNCEWGESFGFWFLNFLIYVWMMGWRWVGECGASLPFSGVGSFSHRRRICGAFLLSANATVPDRNTLTCWNIFRDCEICGGEERKRLKTILSDARASLTFTVWRVDVRRVRLRSVVVLSTETASVRLFLVPAAVRVPSSGCRGAAAAQLAVRRTAVLERVAQRFRFCGRNRRASVRSVSGSAREFAGTMSRTNRAWRGTADTSDRWWAFVRRQPSRRSPPRPAGTPHTSRTNPPVVAWSECTWSRDRGCTANLCAWSSRSAACVSASMCTICTAGRTAKGKKEINFN